MTETSKPYTTDTTKLYICLNLVTVSPVKNKSKLSSTLAADYILIAAFYLLLALTGSIAVGVTRHYLDYLAYSKCSSVACKKRYS